MIDRRLFILAATASLLCAQDTLEPKAMLEDFALFRSTLEAVHPGLYRYTPKAQMDAQFDAGGKKLNHPMSPMQFRLVLTTVLAAMKCGHTRLGDDAAAKDAVENSPLFPFQIFQDGHRFYVVENRSGDRTVKPGEEILAINGRSMESLAKEIESHFGADGDIETGKRQRLARTFPASYRMVIGPAETYEVKLKDRTVKVGGVKRADFAKGAENNPVNADVRAKRQTLEWWKENISLRILSDPEVAQLRIGGFGGAGFPADLEKAFATMRERGTKTLVLDLRGNGGGDDNYGALLVSYLGGEPFRYFDRIQMVTIDPPREHTDFPDRQRERLREGTKPNPAGGFLVQPVVHQGLNEQQPGKSYFKGKTIVLIDGGCFSTCADVAAVTHHLKRATFLGEETGGAYYGNNSGAGITLTLPNSKIPVSIPMWEYWNAVPGYAQTRRGTLPDQEVAVHVADVVEGRDVVLEAAMTRARRP